MDNIEKSLFSNRWNSFWTLIIQYRPSRWIIGVAILLGLGETLLALLVPLLTMNLVDVLSTASINYQLIAILVIVFLGQALMSGFSYYMMAYVGQHIIAGLRNHLWNHLVRLPIPYFDQESSGEMMSRVTHDTNVIKDFITANVIPFFSGIISIIGALLFLLWIDWKMTALMLLSVPLAVVVLLPLGSKMFAISKAMQDETAKFQGDLGRVLGDIRLVKASNAEEIESTKGGKRISELFTYGLKESKIQAIVSPLMMTIMLLVLVILIGYGGFRVSTGTLSAGGLVAIILYMFQIIVPFTTMASFFTQFQKAMGATSRIQEIFKQEQENHQLANEVSKRDSLRFENVSFSYQPDKKVLKDISFTSKPGEVIGLVGQSGSGKTTIFSLLERFYEPTAGAIYVGNQNLSSIDLKSWRNNIAYVSQESPMMAGTIRANVTYGLGNITDEQIKNAMTQASLDSFISSLPLQYDTEVGERGIKLSGGQRQRLAIARAILRDPDILLLDEATAHLDSASELDVQTALQRLMKGRTTLVIAHRLSTVRHANKLLVIENGEITGQGTHDELYVTHSFYRKLFEQQFTNR
ncbi:ABC transporter ATP-binding protein [Bacillus alkalicellulosilyticus]|uniref:ABC transporter ATP-binding protein n=1 Tax=Alkalihalobacterium alkalicellulosilyticum TaxID=1912214 RepID=UPI001483CBC9|nr:ABC transporter ATP-binding protein [Bacillus alkalicellulosilyticus]